MDAKVKALNLQLAVFNEQSPEDAAQNASRLQMKIDDLMDQLDEEVQKRNEALREARQFDRQVSQFESQLSEKEKLKEVAMADLQRANEKLRKTKGQVDTLVHICLSTCSLH